MLLLRDAVIRDLMADADVVTGLERMLSRPTEGALELPPRITMDVSGARGFHRLMPVIAYDTGYAGYKAMNYHPVHGVRYVIAMTDLETGELVAMLDADWITAFRTAATAAIAVKHLAPSNARQVTVIGSGTQARALLEASATVLRPDRVLVCSRTVANREQFARDLSTRLDLDIEPIGDTTAALKSADVVLSAIRAGSEPVIRGDAVREGALVCGISSVRPQHREVDMDLWSRSRVVVDDLPHVRESGDGLAATELHLTSEQEVKELWQVLQDPAQGRRSDSERVLFKSVGTAEQDIALAALVVRRAREAGIGQVIEDFPAVRPIQSRRRSPQR
ncbi:ornithine cyclodeaminase family protein [Nocardia alni]|uniref:ornithine cyclodeaminase family protein n=1 Tax=Nocardia alni TaxID=2815723 RepID=UPI001C222131|nr:ornithine cyclodeaminase family protein [Nocardia alni]